MSEWNGLIDGPPPPDVVARFSETTAAAIRDFVTEPCDRTSAAIAAVLQDDRDMDPAAIDAVISEMQARLVDKLRQADHDFRALAGAIGVRTWRNSPVNGWRRAPLTISRRRPNPTMSADKLLADAGDIARAPGGHVNADAPRHQLRVEDFDQSRARLAVSGDAVLVRGQGR